MTNGVSEKKTNPKDAVGIKKAPISTLSGVALLEVSAHLGFLIPGPVMLEVGLGMLEGARKYGRFNYREAGVRASVYYDATGRHLLAFLAGEDVDPDSGLSHITKSLCSLFVLLDALRMGKCEDDRPPKYRGVFADIRPATKTPKRELEREVEFVFVKLVEWWEGGDTEVLVGAMALLVHIRIGQIGGSFGEERRRLPEEFDGWMPVLNKIAASIVEKIRPNNPEEPITEISMQAKLKERHHTPRSVAEAITSCCDASIGNLKAIPDDDYEDDTAKRKLRKDKYPEEADKPDKDIYADVAKDIKEKIETSKKQARYEADIQRSDVADALYGENEGDADPRK